MGVSDTTTHESPSTQPAVQTAPPPILCRRCAYDLSGIDPSANCPECGLPIGRTLAGDRLSESDPQWVAMVAKGMWLGVAAAMLAVLLLFPQAVDAINRNEKPGAVNVLPWIISFGGTFMALAGVWLLTTPEPGVWRQPLGNAVRLILRMGFVILTAHRLIQSLGAFNESIAEYRRLAPVAEASIKVLVTVCWWVYVRRILLRIPRRGLAMAAMYAMATVVVLMLTKNWVVVALELLGWRDAWFDLNYSTPGVVGERLSAAFAVVIAGLSARAISEVAAAIRIADDPGTNQPPPAEDS
jgi:hypothetical protein